MKKVVLLFSVAGALLAGTAMAQKSRLYLMCNHTAHEGGRGVRVGGPYDRIADCDEDRIAHRNNHGIGGKYFYVQCSWRSTPP